MEDRVQNQQDIQQRILNFIRIRGPSLPVHIAKETKLNSLLAGAFLSSLASDKMLRISNMKVGNSPLYFLSGQENMLENFYTYLKGKEKEAFLLLKEKGILQDDEQEPAIRVALRSIKDFAHSFSLDTASNLIFWRFHSIKEQEAVEKAENKLKLSKPEAKIEIKPEPIIEIQPKIKVEVKKEISLETKQAGLEIFPEKPEIKEKKAKRKTRKKKVEDKFLEEIKKYLAEKNIQLLNVEKFNAKEVVARIRTNEREILLLALDKKRADESDLIRAHKKALVMNLPYSILTRGETPRKIKEAIDTYKNLASIDIMQEKREQQNNNL